VGFSGSWTQAVSWHSLVESFTVLPFLPFSSGRPCALPHSQRWTTYLPPPPQSTGKTLPPRCPRSFFSSVVFFYVVAERGHPVYFEPPSRCRGEETGPCRGGGDWVSGVSFFFCFFVCWLSGSGVSSGFLEPLFVFRYLLFPGGGVAAA